MNLVLIGYRGCGKSSVGRQVAQALGAAFVDIDDEVCKHFGQRSVAEIWQEQGEPAYRAAEVQVTRQAMTRDHQVVALGGGTLMQDQARQAIVHADHTRRLYLACDAAVLHQRITGDTRSGAIRPALTALGGGLAEVKHMLDQREPVYRAVADHVIDVTQLSVQEAVEQVLTQWPTS